MRPANRMRETRRIKQFIRPLRGEASDHDELLAFIGEARLALIGVASHGTREFFAERAALTRRLVAERGFSALALAADVADVYRVNAYVHRAGRSRDALAALRGFRRFPSWVWRNTEVADFVDWLARFNAGLSAEEQVGVYGLDFYSRDASASAALAYLERADPAAAARARYRYAAFDQFHEDTGAPGYAPSFALSRSLEDEAVEQLRDLQRAALEEAQQEARVPEADAFYGRQATRLGRNAEQYYRSMFGGRVSAWNLRDRHMMDILAQLVAHLESGNSDARIVLWAHNGHIGDARATDVARSGEINLGQLIRERWGTDVVTVGLTTYRGSVTAASEWRGMAERMPLPPALRGSYEDIFHSLDSPDFTLFTPDAEAVLPARRPERAVGVVYRPEADRITSYLEASLARQFDAIIHFDETHAVEPLDNRAQWRGSGPPETPSGR